MINIQKTGNAIVVDFTDNDKYLNNGTIEVAPNELMVVIDDSNMATFKKMSNGDTLFGQLINQIKIQGESVTKDNIIEKFGTIGFSISSGGGEGGAVSSVNGQIGDVVITATSLGAITKADADTLYATKQDLNSKADAIADMATQTWVQNQGYLTEVPSNYVTDSELTEGLAGKQDKGDYALKSDLNTLATKEELATKVDALSSKQDTLVSGTNIKTINGETILGSGNLVIQSGTSNWDDIQGKPQFAEVATSGDYNDLINKPTIPDVSDLATKQEIAGKQDTLVSGTNIKTINGNSVLGAGDITIQAGGTIDTAMSDTSENAVQNKVIKKYIDDLVGNILTQLQEINGTIA